MVQTPRGLSEPATDVTGASTVIAVHSRALSPAGIFGLFAAFVAFIFAGGSSGKPPSDPPRPRLPSTLPPPAEPPPDAPATPPQGPPATPPTTRGKPSRPRDEPPLDPRSLIALASYFPTVVRWLRTLDVREHDRQDVAQKVLLIALKRWGALVTAPHLSEVTGRRLWLFAVTCNAAKHYNRWHASRRERLVDPTEDDADIPSGEPSPEELLSQHVDGIHVAADVDLGRLRAATSAENWSAFYANVVEGLPLRIIAAAQGVPIGTVATRLRAAKRDLRAAISRARAQRAGEEQRSRFRRT